MSSTAHAGQLLSKFLKEIANEETELLTIDGEDRMTTKAEALARLMWRMALGYEEETIASNGQRSRIAHAPDKKMMALLFDRIEGRATILSETQKGQTVADKVSEQGKQRIAQAGVL